MWVDDKVKFATVRIFKREEKESKSDKLHSIVYPLSALFYKSWTTVARVELLDFCVWQRIIRSFFVL